MRLKKSLKFLTACLLLTACNPERNGSSSKPTAYDRVIKSNTITAGYLVYPPACIKDPNSGELSGIHIETMEAVAKSLDLKIEWKEASGWATMIEDVNSGKVDLIGSAVWANATRGKHADFGTPLYWSGVCAFVRSNDNRFDNKISEIDSPSIKLATIDGEMAEMIANTDFPKADRFSLPQNSELSLALENVAISKADVAFAEQYFVGLYSKSNPGKLKNITPDSPLRVFPNCILLPKGDTKLKSMLDTALEEQINSGYVDSLIDKYVGPEGGVFRNARPYRSSR